MNPAGVFFVGLIAFWLLLNLASRLLEKRAPRAFQQLRSRNIVISPTSAGIETEYFNSSIAKFATTWRQSVHLWFSVGAAVGAACLVLTMVYLLPSYLYSRFLLPQQEQTVDIQIPGVTIPMEYVPHVLVAIFLTLAFHELGHALSGTNDNKAIDKIGFVVQLFIPTAYVRFTDHHYDLSAWRQLKVYCAGAWHNFVLYAVAWLLIANSSFWLSPLYQRPTAGQTVSFIKFNPEVTPLQIGDTVIGLNHCSISTAADWNDCIQNLLSNNCTYCGAVCGPEDWISSSQSDTSDLECCGEDYNGPVPCWKEAKPDGKQLCKTARDMWPSNVRYCEQTNDKSIPTCPVSGNKCYIPSLLAKYEDRGLKLMQIRVLRETDPSKEPLRLHVRQHPWELLNQVSFQQYEPRWAWMPSFTSHWADATLVVLSLLLSFNLITPIVSLLPVYAFDGEFALFAISLLILPDLDDDVRNKWIDWIRNVTTVVFVLVLLSSLLPTLW